MVRCVSRRYKPKLVVFRVSLISEQASLRELRELQKIFTTRECAELVLCHIQQVMIRIGGARYATSNLLEYITSSNSAIHEISNASNIKDDRPFLVISSNQEDYTTEENNENSKMHNDQEKIEEEQGALCGMCVLAIKYNVTQCGLAALNLLRAACALTNHIYVDMDEMLDRCNNHNINTTKVKRRTHKLSEASMQILRSMHGTHFSCAVRVERVCESG